MESSESEFQYLLYDTCSGDGRFVTHADAVGMELGLGELKLDYARARLREESGALCRVVAHRPPLCLLACSRERLDALGANLVPPLEPGRVLHAVMEAIGDHAGAALRDVPAAGEFDEQEVWDLLCFQNERYAPCAGCTQPITIWCPGCRCAGYCSPACYDSRIHSSTDCAARSTVFAERVRAVRSRLVDAEPRRTLDHNGDRPYVPVSGRAKLVTDLERLFSCEATGSGIAYLCGRRAVGKVSGNLSRPSVSEGWKRKDGYASILSWKSGPSRGTVATNGGTSMRGRS